MKEALAWAVDYVKIMFGGLATSTAKKALALVVPIIIDLADGDGQWNETTRAKAQGLVLVTLRDAGLLKGHSSD